MSDPDPRELRIPVQTIRIKYLCAACGTGMMIYHTDQAMRPYRLHRCDNCGVVEALDEIHPRIDYIEG